MVLRILGWGSLFLLAGANRGAYAATVEIAPDRMAVVNGQRTFVIGLYENASDDAVLESVAKAGFNLVQAKPNRQDLDRLQQYDLYGWVNTGYRIDLQTDAETRKAQLRELVSALADHPALLVWEAPDEALWNVWYNTLCQVQDERNALQARIQDLSDVTEKARLDVLWQKAQDHFACGEFERWEEIRDEVLRSLDLESPGPERRMTTMAARAHALAVGMKSGYGFLKGIDPRHPLWMNHAPRNSIAQLAEFGEAADIVGCDIYPVPSCRTGHSDLMDKSLSCVGAYTIRMQQSAPTKPVWMVLQGFGWADISQNPEEDREKGLRRPTAAESRFMAFDAIVRGARGILYWGTGAVEKPSEFWEDLLHLAGEIADLQPVLAAPDASMSLEIAVAETWGSLDRCVEVLAKDVDGAPWLLVVNEWSEQLHVTLRGLQAYEGLTFCDTASGREAGVTGGTLTFGIAGHGVYVFEPKHTVR